MKLAISSLKFVAGVAANLVCQSARSAVNLLGFAALAISSSSLLILSLLQIIGGGMARGKQTATLSWSHAKLSAKMLAFSLLQAVGVMTLLGALVRGSQACTERLMPMGVYAPKHPSNVWQTIFGLNSWQQPEENKQEDSEKDAPPEPVIQGIAKKSPMSELAIQSVAKKNPPKMKVIRKTKENGEWADLSRRYMEARSREEMDAIRTIMATKHPILYIRALSAARRVTKKKKAA